MHVHPFSYSAGTGTLFLVFLGLMAGGFLPSPFKTWKFLLSQGWQVTFSSGSVCKKQTVFKPVAIFYWSVKEQGIKAVPGESGPCCGLNWGGSQNHSVISVRAEFHPLKLCFTYSWAVEKSLFSACPDSFPGPASAAAAFPGAGPDELSRRWPTAIGSFGYCSNNPGRC